MLQVRVISRAAATDPLVAYLASMAGVLNLVVLPQTARCPEGDTVSFDLQTASANPVLEHLRDLPLDQRGPVTVQFVDAAIGEPEAAAVRVGSRHAELAPVWDLVRARIQNDAVYAPSFFMLLAISGVIAACGILTNSQILIVAAMVVGPEYGAIISVAYGIETRDWTAVRRGSVALSLGFLSAIALSLIFALCIHGVGITPAAYDKGLRPVSDLINSPDLFSVVVAFLAGIVGVVSLTEARANALIGVFISVTTIPAAADIAVSIAYGHWREAKGSTIQLLLNVGLLIIVGAIALRLQRLSWRNHVKNSLPREG